MGHDFVFFVFPELYEAFKDPFLSFSFYLKSLFTMFTIWSKFSSRKSSFHIGLTILSGLNVGREGGTLWKKRTNKSTSGLKSTCTRLIEGPLFYTSAKPFLYLTWPWNNLFMFKCQE